MTITYSWLIDTMVVYPTSEGLSDVVIQVNCERRGNYEGYTAFVGCSVSLPPPKPNDFIPYQQLTQAEVDEWLNTYVDPTIVAGYDSQIQASIENQINPPTQVLPVPWPNNG